MRNPRRWQWLVVVFGMLGMVRADSVPGQPPAEENWLVDRKLTLTPMSAPMPAFRYRLFPLQSELRDGNAAPVYLRLAHEQSDAARKYWTETPRRWNEGPIDQIPESEAREFLQRMSQFYRQFDLAARRKFANWNHTIDQGTVIDLLLPEISTMRNYVPMMVLRARMQIRDGDFSAAARSLETGFAFSRHVAAAPFLINALVGMACAGQFADCVLDFVNRPGAPNLYWALTALPQPLIDLRLAMEYEQRFFELEFPQLKEMERPRTPAQWDALLKQLRLKVKQVNSTLGDGKAPEAIRGTGPDDPASQSPDLPGARKYVTDRHGLSPAAVDAMPPAQVLMLCIAGVNDDIRDENFTSVYVPFLESQRALLAAAERLKPLADTEASRIARMWLPAFRKVLLAQMRLERKVAALRVIEALRMHAAANGGRLPEALEQIKAVPVPPDPGTGRPFEYRMQGDTAILTGRIPGEPLEQTGLRYTISVGK